jgi:sugar O-acyltransferase (sialic acid O-acetyltransferase NeuD family)
MKRLVIICARGFGREIYNLALDAKGYKEDFDIKGFLDDNNTSLDDYCGYPPVLTSVENYSISPDDVFICAIGNGHIKQKYVDIIKQKGGSFISLIHNSSIVGKNTAIGEGCIITQNVNISCDVKIGDFVTLQPFTNISHDCIIGNYCHLNSFVVMGGGSSIGNFVTVHASSVLLFGAKVEDNIEIEAGSSIH